MTAARGHPSLTRGWLVAIQRRGGDPAIIDGGAGGAQTDPQIHRRRPCRFDHFHLDAGGELAVASVVGRAPGDNGPPERARLRVKLDEGRRRRRRYGRQEVRCDGRNAYKRYQKPEHFPLHRSPLFSLPSRRRTFADDTLAAQAGVSLPRPRQGPLALGPLAQLAQMARCGWCDARA